MGCKSKSPRVSDSVAVHDDDVRCRNLLQDGKERGDLPEGEEPGDVGKRRISGTAPGIERIESRQGQKNRAGRKRPVLFPIGDIQSHYRTDTR